MNAIAPVAPAGGGNGGTSDYGLGAWGSKPINIAGLPVSIVADLSKAGIDTTQPVTGDKLVAALGSIKDSSAIQALQQMLYYSGFYPASVNSIADVQLGSFGQQDESALQNAVQTAGQTGSNLGSYLTQRANQGMAQGKIASLTPKTTAGIITTPNDDAVNAALKSAAESILGHDVSPDQYSQFRALFDAQYVAGQKAAILAQLKANATVGVPNSADLGQAMADRGQGPLGAAGAISAPGAVPAVPGQLDATQLTDQIAPFGKPDATQLTDQIAPTAETPNNAQGAYEQRVAGDTSVVNQYNQAATALNANNGITTVQGAPDPSASAQAFIQANDSAGVQAQSNVQRYEKLLSFLKGGS